MIVYDADYNENPSIIGNACLTQYYGKYLDSFHEPDNPVWKEMRQTIEAVRPDVVGITMCTAYAASAFRVAEISKSIDPACPVIVGGPHATVRAEEVLAICPAVDYVVRGEGEITARELIGAIADSWVAASRPKALAMAVPHPRKTIAKLPTLPPLRS